MDSAISDCSETLLEFANRWPIASVYHETFMALLTQTPLAAVQVEQWQFPQDQVSIMETHLARLRELRTHRSVLAIIEAIIRPQGLNLEDTDPLMSLVLDPMNSFELVLPAYGGDIFSFDP